MMQDVDAHPRERVTGPPASQDQRVQRAVQSDQGQQRCDQDGRPAHQDAEQGDQRRESAQPVVPAQVQVARHPAGAKQQGDPRDASMSEVGAKHSRKRPPLQVGALDLRVEPDPRPGVDQAHPELDVLDRGARELLLVESPGVEKRLAANRPQPGPERLRGTGRLMVHVVMEQVPETRDGTRGAGLVIVGAEHPLQRRVALEGGADPSQGVVVHDDVGVDEDEDLGVALARSGVSGGRRPRIRRIGHRDHLVGRLGASADRVQALRQRRRAVGGRDDHADRRGGGGASHCAPTIAVGRLRAVAGKWRR